MEDNSYCMNVLLCGPTIDTITFIVSMVPLPITHDVQILLIAVNKVQNLAERNIMIINIPYTAAYILTNCMLLMKLM